MNVISSKTPEPVVSTRPYQDIIVTREELKSYLEASFTSEGMSDEIDMAEKTIACESNFVWYASNSISKGVAQFTEPTYKQFCAGNYDDMNPQQQLNCFTKLWKMNMKYKWDCFCTLFGKDNLQCIKRGF